MIRVCMFPARNSKNEAIEIMAKAAVDTGEVEVIPFSFTRSFFQRFDIFHVHWPEGVLTPAPRPRVLIKFTLFMLFLGWTRLRGRKIVWTAHNVGSHEKAYPILEKLFWRYFLDNVDHIIHLCPQSRDALVALHGGVVNVPDDVVPHPHYRSVYASPPDRAEARRHLGIGDDVCVFLFFGLIRPYKGVETLVDAFQQWSEPSVRLIIAGEMKGVFTDGVFLKNATASDNRITHASGYIQTDDLVTLIRACDCVILPYKALLNSGVANAALSLDRPIMAPATGCILDYHDRLGGRWVQFLGDDITQDMIEFRSRADGLRSDHDVPNLDFADAKRIGEKLFEIYARHSKNQMLISPVVDTKS